MPVIHIAPEWEPLIVEKIQFFTDILIAYDDTEQRVKLRGTPKRSISESFLMATADEVEKIAALVYDGQESNIDVPTWWDARLLTAQANIGATTLTVDTTNTEFTNGNKVLIYGDDQTYEVVTLTGVSPTFVNCTATTKSWAANQARVVPIWNLVWDAEVVLSHLNGEIGSARLEFRSV